MCTRVSVNRGVGVGVGASRGRSRVLSFFFKEYCFRVRVRVGTNMVTTQRHGHNNDRSTRAGVIARVRCIYCNVPIQIKLKNIN